MWGSTFWPIYNQELFHCPRKPPQTLWVPFAWLLFPLSWFGCGFHPPAAPEASNLVDLHLPQCLHDRPSRLPHWILMVNFVIIPFQRLIQSLCYNPFHSISLSVSYSLLWFPYWLLVFFLKVSLIWYLDKFVYLVNIY